MRPMLPAFACVWALSTPAASQSLDAETLQLFQTTAAGICGDFSREGSANEAGVEGSAEARLKGLAGKLTDLDIEGAGKLSESGYVGVLREELGDELKDVRTCRREVFLQLLAAVPAALPEAEPAGLPAAPPETEPVRMPLAAPEPEPVRPPGPLRPWCTSTRLNPTERAICGNERLARLDAELEVAYGQAKASRQDSEQGAWLLERNACGEDPSCIAHAYSDRIWQLQQ